MAIADQDIVNWFLANQGADDATVAATMNQFSLTPEDIARATGSNVADVQSRYDAVTPAATTGAIEQVVNNDRDVSSNTTTGALTQAAPVDTVAQDYWTQQAALQQAEWERQAAAQQAEWERQAAVRDAVTTTTGGLPSTVTTPAGSTTPANQLGGVILAGASWMAGDEKTNLANQAFGQNVTNTAVGGQKTSDVLNQLNVDRKSVV